MTLLDVVQLRQVLDGARNDLLRWETLPAYEVASDGTDYRRYLDGAAEPNWQRKQPWLDTLRAWADGGRARRRVRVIHDPGLCAQHPGRRDHPGDRPRGGPATARALRRDGHGLLARRCSRPSSMRSPSWPRRRATSWMPCCCPPTALRARAAAAAVLRCRLARIPARPARSVRPLRHPAVDHAHPAANRHPVRAGRRAGAPQWPTAAAGAAAHAVQRAARPAQRF